VDSPTKHPSSVRPVTIANLVKSHMARAGVDTAKFKAHSIRAAASARAVQAGGAYLDGETSRSLVLTYQHL
jgi:hypothetical protein